MRVYQFLVASGNVKKLNSERKAVAVVNLKKKLPAAALVLLSCG